MNQDEYRLDNMVMAELLIDHSGGPKDVIVNAVIKSMSANEIMAGLLLRTLKGLSGPASYSLEWNGSGFAPGWYYVEATLQEPNGNLLSRETRLFRLGVSAGEISQFVVTPSSFKPGVDVDIALSFFNSGTTSITGTAVIQVYDEAGEIVQVFQHDILDLAPNSSIAFNDTWSTFGIVGGKYVILGYVSYDGKATDPKTAIVSTTAAIYLPLVSKGSP
jgi:hypothetical protein